MYDLGGGTFDISILEIQKGVFEVSWFIFCCHVFIDCNFYRRLTLAYVIIVLRSLRNADIRQKLLQNTAFSAYLSVFGCHYLV